MAIVLLSRLFRIHFGWQLRDDKCENIFSPLHRLVKLFPTRLLQI